MKERKRGGAFTRTAQKCQECEFRDKCDNKRMEACAYLYEPDMSEATMPSAAELAQPMMVKHDYRDIKIAENTTITIDVEDLKKQMEEEIYRALGCGFNYGA